MFNTHQNHQNMRFDLIYCVQKESISPFWEKACGLNKVFGKNVFLVMWHIHGT